jgi:hypothetical protein
MARTKTEVQTPGESPTAPAAPPADAFQAVATTIDPAAEASNEDLRAMILAQNAQISALMAAVTNVQRVQAQPAGKLAQEASLPDIADVDVAAINAGQTPVLTKQGWVVPPSFGTDPARLQELKDQAEQRRINAALAKKLAD